MDATIYMPLLNEGTTVWRPVTASSLGEGRFRITDTQPADEEWAYAPGMTVIVDSGRRIIAEVAA